MSNSDSIIIKTPKEVKLMAQGGKKLARVKKALMKAIKLGVSAAAIEKMANRLIKKEKASPSFKMVPGYSWATCINLNEGIVHGIPHKEIIFKKGDIVSVDVGLFYKGFHSDTSFTVAISPTKEIKKFLKAGQKALEAAIKKAQPDNRVYDISKAIEKTLRKDGLQPLKALVGHGVGRELHEAPHIPCYIDQERKKTPKLPEGSVIAIEVMYTKGSPEIRLEKDGWTISMRDGKISGLFEETVAVTGNGPVVLTKAD